MFNQIKKCFSLLDRRARRHAVLLFVFMLIASVLEAVSVGVILPLIKILAEPDIIHQNETLNTIYETLGLGSTKAFVIFTIVATGAVFLLKNALNCRSSPPTRLRVTPTARISHRAFTATAIPRCIRISPCLYKTTSRIR